MYGTVSWSRVGIPNKQKFLPIALALLFLALSNQLILVLVYKHLIPSISVLCCDQAFTAHASQLYKTLGTTVLSNIPICIHSVSKTFALSPILWLTSAASWSINIIKLCCLFQCFTTQTIPA